MLVVTLGAALRMLAMAASGPISLFLNDSLEYLNHARHLVPDGYHPLGYPAFLAIVFRTGHPLVITWTQHALGLGTGLLIAVVAARLGLPMWGAALAAAPVLLDPYVVVVEQMVMAEAVFLPLVVGLLAILLLARRGTVRPYAVAGLLCAAAVLTRSAGIALLVPLALWLWLHRPGWRASAALTIVIAIPLVAYAGWFASRHGRWSFTEHSGVFLYSRMASFADCQKVMLNDAQRVLCDPRPLAQRPQTNWYLWHPEAPFKNMPGDLAHRAELATKTGRDFVLAEPGRWLSTTVRFIAQYAVVGPWLTTARRVDTGFAAFRASMAHSTAPPRTDPRLADGFRVTAHVSPGPMRALMQYQRLIGTPMPIVAALLLVGVVALIRASARQAAPFVLTAGSGLALLLLPSALVAWDLRYLLPALGPFGLAAGLAVSLARTVTWRRT